MKIIGLTGRARAGKDTAAGIILEWAKNNGADFTIRQGFADLLKLSAFRALGGAPSVSIDKAVQFCDELKQDEGRLTITLPTDSLDPIREYGLTGREFLQDYGTEAHRDVFGEEFWVNALFDHVEANGPDFGYDLLIIPDCRFDNEAAAVVARGGEVWEVMRPQHGDELKSGLEHTSEAGVDPNLVSVRINNDSTLESLTTTIHSICEERLEGAK